MDILYKDNKNPTAAPSLSRPGTGKLMISNSSGMIPLDTKQDVVRARLRATQLADECGLGKTDQAKLITAVSELARNVIIHGVAGQMNWDLVHDGNRRGVRVSFRDNGPGIPDVAAAMTDGWTSGSGMGLGLPGSKRLVDAFKLVTAPSAGTCVTIIKWDSPKTQR